jgi:predicted metal-dependent phosphoesterase TrpH/glycosyltransferase involved in cell wall biosynthesis
VPEERFSIAQVTPYGWEQHHEVNSFVERLSDELCGRGHRVVVVAPSDNRELIRESRATIKRCAEDPESIFAGPGCAQVLGVGQSLAARRSGPVSLPLDVSRTIEDLLTSARFDFVHVHEPFAPSAASAALRHSRALNVGTFHSTTERLISTQVARKLVELVFGRLDARTASYAVTRDLVQRFFPGEYRVIHPGADVVPRPPRPEEREIVEILLCLEEERAALRFFLRAIRRLPPELPWHVTVWSREPDPEPAVPLARAIRDRVRFVGPQSGSQAQHLAGADIVVAASSGTTPAPQMLLRGMAGGAVPVASRLPLYEEVLDDGELGLLFEPRDVDTLAAQLARLVADGELRGELGRRVAETRETLDWSTVADEFEALYGEVAARRHSDGNPAVRRRLGGRDLIHVDLHMHTNHSHDCATPVDKLLETAKERGLGAIAVTDHNEVSGALEARERANGIKVIVGEEVKTADQGEVIGLFIEEKIPRGLTLQETIAAIRTQGGLVYVPHPFDRMHSVPDYEHLLDVVEDIDAIEVFNPRVAFSAFNEEAERFAAKYRIVAGAGSDSHVPQGLGSVKIAMRDFDGPEEFLESLRDADIVRRKQSLLYVQALKFIQTQSPSGRKSKGSGSNAPAGRRPTRARTQAPSGRRRPRSGNK